MGTSRQIAWSMDAQVILTVRQSYTGIYSDLQRPLGAVHEHSRDDLPVLKRSKIRILGGLGSGAAKRVIECLCTDNS